MGQRKFRADRCPGCGLHQERCVCASRPTIDLATRVVFVQHNRERHKPTNTARLARSILVGAELTYYGAREPPMDTSPLDHDDRDYLVLFPREDASVLSPETCPIVPGRTRTLVILDGTWHQCSRMTRRVPRVRDMPCVALPEGPPSAWGIRTPPRPGALSTFEAVARALALLHGDDAVAPMLAWFQALTAQLWEMRGGAPVDDDEDDDA